MNFSLADTYMLFTEMLDRPTQESYVGFRTGIFLSQLKELAEQIKHPPIHFKDIPACFEEYESMYIQLFDVGVPNPPFPLLETHYYTRDPAPATIHENIMFYQAFGLELNSQKELPNHLIHQIEFLAYLSGLLDSHELESKPDVVMGIYKAKKDYLSRHIFNWYPKMLHNMEVSDFPDFYLQIFKFLLRLFEDDFEKTSLLVNQDILTPTHPGPR
jgi:DMSO reductase family type II enzyme chaperone